MIRTTIISQLKMITVVIFLLIIDWGVGHTLQIEIKDNKLSAVANQIPMQDVLKKIAIDYGLTLRMDPAINPPITVSFQNRDLENGLKSILQPYNHVLFWKPNPDHKNNPSAPAYVLVQIQVFKPGKKGQMVNINTPVKPTIVAPKTMTETKVIIKGNKVFVPVTLAYQDREIQTTLLFDTGASSIVLHENVAEQLAIDKYQIAQGRGVGGIQINTKVAELSYVAVGPNKKTHLRADIVEYEGPADEHYNGLLGMNFIRGLKYIIDFNNETIQWRP